MKKRHTAAFRTKAVQEVLKVEKTIAQIASGYGIQLTQVSTWKSSVLTGLPDVFEKRMPTSGQRRKNTRNNFKSYTRIP
jgi:transposase-like protein